jgi:1-acyl-sn-glycerol-3-phosphate acyltransferase
MKDRWLVRLIRAVFDFLFWLLTRRSFHGLENMPASGPFLLVTNHISYVDPPLIFIGIRRAGIVGLVADNYKTNPLFRWLVDSVGSVWINRGAGDRGAVKAALGVLKDGRILGMAPEGTRSKVTHALMQGKSGAAFIASKAGVPVLPIGVTGAESVLRDLKRLRRPVVTFTAGPVFTLPPLEGQENKSKALDEYTHEIMCRIAALLPEQYQGVYKGDPRIEEIKAEQRRA